MSKAQEFALLTMLVALTPLALPNAQASELPVEPGSCEILLSGSDAKSASTIFNSIIRLHHLELSQDATVNEQEAIRGYLDGLRLQDPETIKTLIALVRETRDSRPVYLQQIDKIFKNSLEKRHWNRLNFHSKFALIKTIDDRGMTVQTPEIPDQQLRAMVAHYSQNGTQAEKLIIIKKYFYGARYPELYDLLPAAIIRASVETQGEFLSFTFNSVNGFKNKYALKLLIEQGSQAIIQRLARSLLDHPDLIDHQDVLELMIAQSDPTTLSAIASDFAGNPKLGQMPWQVRKLARTLQPGAQGQSSLIRNIFQKDLAEPLADVIQYLYDLKNMETRDSIVQSALDYKGPDRFKPMIREHIQNCSLSFFRSLPFRFKMAADANDMREWIELWIDQAPPEETVHLAEDFLKDSKSHAVTDLLDPFLLKASPEALSHMKSTPFTESQVRLIQIRLHELVFSGGPKILDEIAAAFTNPAVRSLGDLRHLIATLGGREALSNLLDSAFTAPYSAAERADLRLLIERMDLKEHSSFAYQFKNKITNVDDEIQILTDSLSEPDTELRREFLHKKLDQKPNR